MDRASIKIIETRRHEAVDESGCSSLLRAFVVKTSLSSSSQHRDPREGQERERCGFGGDGHGDGVVGQSVEVGAGCEAEARDGLAAPGGGGGAEAAIRSRIRKARQEYRRSETPTKSPNAAAGSACWTRRSQARLRPSNSEVDVCGEGGTDGNGGSRWSEDSAADSGGGGLEGQTGSVDRSAAGRDDVGAGLIDGDGVSGAGRGNGEESDRGRQGAAGCRG